MRAKQPNEIDEYAKSSNQDVEANEENIMIQSFVNREQKQATRLMMIILQYISNKLALQHATVTRMVN